MIHKISSSQGHFFSRISFSAFFFCLASSLVTLSGCETIEDRRGFFLSPQELTALKKGINTMTKNDVSALIGFPTYIFSFDKNSWHYLGETITREAFFRPTLSQSPSYILCFDANGVLLSIEESEGPVDITISSEETVLPSDHGTEVLRQMFHKFGKFPKATPSAKAPH